MSALRRVVLQFSKSQSQVGQTGEVKSSVLLVQRENFLAIP